MTAVSGYAARAARYAAEIADVPGPMLLDGLLRSGLRVAEMPSGTGHFLPAYAIASAEVTLARILEPGGLLLVQVLRTASDGTAGQGRAGSTIRPPLMGSGRWIGRSPMISAGRWSAVAVSAVTRCGCTSTSSSPGTGRCFTHTRSSCSC